METYSVRVKCINCGYGTKLGTITKAFIDIPKGKTIDEYLKTVECPVCGCKTIRKKGFILF